MFHPVYKICDCGCAGPCTCKSCHECFPAEAEILLDTDETIQVKDLRVGHRVLTGIFNQNLEQDIEL